MSCLPQLGLIPSVLRCLGFAAAGCFATVGSSAWAAPTLSDQGYTGYTNVPSAFVTPEGRFHLWWSDAVPSADVRSFRLNTQADNYLVSFGMFPRIELGMRLINTGDDDFSAGVDTRFGQTVGQRDLSTNAKALLFSSELWPSLAIGLQDASGNGLFSASYGVASYRWKGLEASLGYGKDRMDGLFYGLSAQLGSYARVLYDDDTVQQVLALEAHSGNLMRGLRLVGRYRAVAEGPKAETGWSLGVEADLGLGARWADASAAASPGWETRRLRTARLAQRAQQAEDCLPSVAQEATRAGLERVRVESVSTQTARGYLLAAEAKRFTHSAVDAVGVAMGILGGSCAAEEGAEFVIQVAENGLPKFWVASAAQEVRAYLNVPGAPPPGVAYGLGAHPDYSGLGPRDGLLADVQLAPAQRYTVATEVGVLDYSVGVESVVTVPLWLGSAFVAEGVDDVAASSDFQRGGPLQGFALDEGWVSRGLQQTLPLWGYGALRGYYGRSTALDKESDLRIGDLVLWPVPGAGLQLETRYSDYEFREPQRIQDGRLSPSHQSAWTGTARYFFGDSSTLLELTWGRFHFEDEGARLRLERFFADTSVAVLYLRDREKDNEALGVSLSMPFGGRRTVPLGPVGLGGGPAWSTTLTTKINARSNVLRPNLLREVLPPGSLNRQYFDRGRLSRSYVQANWPRMRHAFETYVSAD